MFKTRGLVSGFEKGFMFPYQMARASQQEKLGEVQRKQAQENLLKSHILNQYLPRKMEEAQKQAQAAAVLQQQAIAKGQALAPLWEPKMKAALKKMQVSTSLAPELARIAAQNAATREAAVAQSKSRFNIPEYKYALMRRGLPATAMNVILAGQTASPLLKSLSGFAQQSAQDVMAPPQQQAGMQPGMQAPQSPIPQFPLPGVGGGQIPQQPSVPPGALPQQQVPPSPIGAQQQPAAPVTPIHPAEVQRLQETAKESLNKAFTSPQIWNRWQSARVLDDSLRDPGNRDILRIAAKYAGAAGGVKKWKDALSNPNSSEFKKYMQFKNTLNQNISNQIRQMEKLGVTPSQRAEITGIFDSLRGATNLLQNNPKRALAQMNEAGRELNVIATSLEKQAHSRYPAPNPIKPWVPITAEEGKDVVSIKWIYDPSSKTFKEGS